MVVVLVVVVFETKFETQTQCRCDDTHEYGGGRHDGGLRAKAAQYTVVPFTGFSL